MTFFLSVYVHRLHHSPCTSEWSVSLCHDSVWIFNLKLSIGKPPPYLIKKIIQYQSKDCMREILEINYKR